MSETRAATLADIPQLCDLLGALFEQEAEFQPDLARQEAGLRLIIDDPRTGRILAAHRDGELVGMVNLLFTVSTARGGPVAILEDLVVRANARRAGIGTALMRAAIACAVEAGCSRLTLLTDRDNTTAQRFYRSHGFVDSPMMPMRLLLPPTVAG
jgi:GNAT superfamily N-acetyltransferase